MFDNIRTGIGTGTGTRTCTRMSTGMRAGAGAGGGDGAGAWAVGVLEGTSGDACACSSYCRIKQKASLCAYVGLAYSDRRSGIHCQGRIDTSRWPHHFHDDRAVPRLSMGKELPELRLRNSCPICVSTI